MKETIMPGRKVLPLFIIATLLTGCATSQLRVIMPPTEMPVEPTIMVGSEYPAPGGAVSVSKSIPYPEQGALPAEQPAYPPALPAAPANPAPYPLPEAAMELDWQPQAGDDQLLRNEVYLDSQLVVTLKSFPPQFILKLKGNLPTPCHKLRVQVNPPDAARKIQVEVYSLAKPDEICIQMLQPFEVGVPLKDLPAGTYEALVNQQAAGELIVP